MKVVCISDTHLRHKALVMPEGDVLIHAGDLTPRGALGHLKDFATWFDQQNYKYKFVIAGNHDFCFENGDRAEALKIMSGRNFAYLEEDGCEFEFGGKTWKIWGSPWTPWFHSWAFNAERGPEIAEHWANIPDDTEILVTHGPPYKRGDRVYHSSAENGHRLNVGCEDLSQRIKKLKDLRLHVFGHIHEDYGMCSDTDRGIFYVNAASCDLSYKPINDPIVVEL